MIDLVYKVAAFLVTLGVLVVFHELGHYVVARWCGVKVLRFSVGFGRVVWSRRVGPDRTEWALSAIPLGGYVKMADEREGDVAPADLPRAFNRQSVGSASRSWLPGRSPICCSRCCCSPARSWPACRDSAHCSRNLPPATAAAAAGMHGGDLVVALDGDTVRSWQDLRWRLLRAQGRDAVALAVAAQGCAPRGTPAVARAFAGGVSDPPTGKATPCRSWGCAADFGAAAGRRGGRRQAGSAGRRRQRRSHRRGRRRAVRSPGDVALATNASPGAPLTFRIERAGRRSRRSSVTPEAAVQGGKTIGLAGLRLHVDPETAKRLAVTVRYGVVDAFVAGRAQDLGPVGVHAEDAGPHRHRRRVAARTSADR